LLIDRRDPSDPEERDPRRGSEDAQAPPLRIRDAGVGHSAGRRESLALSVEEAAAAIGVARSTFYVNVLPELSVVRIGRRVVVPRRELERWLERSAAILPRHA
jgi:excisionase family DNA binding protein